MNKWNHSLVSITPVVRICNYCSVYLCTARRPHENMGFTRIGASPALFLALYIPSIWNNLGYRGGSMKIWQTNEHRSQYMVSLTDFTELWDYPHLHFQTSRIKYCERSQSLRILSHLHVIFNLPTYYVYYKAYKIKIIIRMRSNKC